MPTLGARDFSSAVSGFCQVFIVTRAKSFFLEKRGTREKPLVSNESIFLSRVEGRGFHVEGEGTMSRAEGNIFFSKFFLEKVKIDAINVIKTNKKNLKKQMTREHLLVVVDWSGGGGGGIEKSSGTSQFVFEELHL